MTDKDTKDKILHSLTNIYFSDGINISMDEIAKRLHISKKTIYKHFKNKEDIIEHILAVIFQRMKKIFDGAFAPHKDPIEAIIDIFTEIPKLINLVGKNFLDGILKYEPLMWQRVEKFRSEMIGKHLPNIFSNGIKKGYFRKDINIKILFLAYIGAIQSILNPTVLSQSSFSADEAIQNLLIILYQGVTTEKGRKKFQEMGNKIKIKKESFR